MIRSSPSIDDRPVQVRAPPSVTVQRKVAPARSVPEVAANRDRRTQENAIAADEPGGIAQSGKALPVESSRNRLEWRRSGLRLRSRRPRRNADGRPKSEAAGGAHRDGLADEDRAVALAKGLHVVVPGYVQGVRRMAQAASERLAVRIDEPDRADLRAARQSPSSGGGARWSARSLPASICEAILDARDGELESAEDVLCVTLKGKRAPLGGDRCPGEVLPPGSAMPSARRDPQDDQHRDEQRPQDPDGPRPGRSRQTLGHAYTSRAVTIRWDVRHRARAPAFRSSSSAPIGMGGIPEANQVFIRATLAASRFELAPVVTARHAVLP